MGRVAGVLDDPPGFPYRPPGVDVLEGGKLTSNNVAGSSHNPLQSFAVASGAVSKPGGVYTQVVVHQEKRKDITNATYHNRVNILVPFDANGTLVTCGTFEDGYCEVLDINDITNSIHYERNILVGLRQNGKSVAFIAGKFFLVGKMDEDAKPQDSLFSVVTLWSTSDSQPGGIFSRIAEISDAIIQSTVRDMEFVDGFQRVSPSESYLFLNAETD